MNFRRLLIGLLPALLAGAAAASAFNIWFTESLFGESPNYQARGIDSGWGRSLVVLACLGVVSALAGGWLQRRWLMIANSLLSIAGIGVVVLAAATYQVHSAGNSWNTTSSYAVSLGLTIGWTVASVSAIYLSRGQPIFGRALARGSGISDMSATEAVDITPLSLGIALVGAGVMVLAVFLPQFESTTFAQIVKNTLIQNGDGWWFIGLALAAAGAAYRAYRSQRRSYATVILGGIGILLAIYYGTSHSQRELCSVNPATLGQNCTLATPGIGIYAAGVGGLLIVIGGWQIYRSDLVESDEEHNADDGQAPSPVSSGGPSGPGGPVPVSASALAERLRALDQLHADGVITDAEHTQRRAALISEI